MADDYDYTEDIENMSDAELKGYILAQLGSQKTIDVNDVTVRVTDGVVCLDGRVGTEEELRIIDHVVTDLIGLSDVDNEIVVDELRRAESPEAIDEAGYLANPLEVEKDLLEAGLADVTLLEEEVKGTHDVQEAIAEAEPWIPPEGPTPEGVSGQEEGRLGIDGRH